MLWDYGKKLSEQETAYHISEMRKGSKASRNVLITRNIALVKHIAMRYFNTCTNQVISMDDLISMGVIGLIKAIDTFKPEKGFKLSSYIAKCVNNEMIMSFRDSKKRWHDISLNAKAVKDRKDLTNAEKLADDAPPVDEQAEININTPILREAIEKALDEKGKKLIRLRYFEGLTLQEIAAEFNYKEHSGAARAIDSALKKLRRELRRKLY